MSSEWFFALIVTYWIHSTLILGGCWCVVRCLRSATPGFENRIWKYAAVAGFVTAFAQSNIGDLPLFRVSLRPLTPARLADSVSVDSEPAPEWESNERSSKWSVSTSVEPIADRLAMSSSATHDLSSARQPIAEPAVMTESDAATSFVAWLNSLAPSPRDLTAVVAIVWLVFGVVWLSWQLVRTYTRVLQMPLADSGRLTRLLREVVHESRLQRRIHLRLDSRRDAEPVALGCFRWTIVVPEKVVDSLSDDELKGVYMHELGHLVRRDYVWKIIGHLLCACAGFQPLNLIARRRWERASEYLCDQWATEHGASRMGLAKCLTKLAECRVRRNPLLAVPATGSKPLLVRRVERLIAESELTDIWQTKRRARMFHVAAVVLVAAMTFAAPAVQATNADSDGLSEDHPAREIAELNEVLPTIVAKIDDDISLSEFESWVRLDVELKGLLRDIEIAQASVVATGDHAQEFAKLRALAAAIEQRRKQIATQFGVGKDQ